MAKRNPRPPRSSEHTRPPSASSESRTKTRPCGFPPFGSWLEDAVAKRTLVLSDHVDPLGQLGQGHPPIMEHIVELHGNRHITPFLRGLRASTCLRRRRELGLEVARDLWRLEGANPSDSSDV